MSATKQPTGPIVNEYREGRDKCIERQTTRGDDVEVEIIEGAYEHTEFEEKFAEKRARVHVAMGHLKQRLSPRSKDRKP